MLPVLRDLTRGERAGQETLDALAEQFALTPDDLAQRLPSGKQATFRNHVAWAKTHMKAAGLVESPRGTRSSGWTPTVPPPSRAR